ncbi:hypothetical protein KO504_07270 [Winogradskyella psychrotolerans]|uniref:hypothetical protein n=1 Tax=Winogradskyella psychrotolerans TaxID=1344585 RepID=UPI001C06CAB6|nr:hypothetical protein [Winogradskyella psychrotolerans]MBU2921139.1 hypothetical protein [Winogradskyella psychrotolerans]
MSENRNLTNQSFNHPVLLEMFSILNLKFLNSNHFSYTENTNIDFDYSKLKKAIWICSILASSTDINHKVRAQRFASLLFLTKNEKKESIDIVRACYVLFSRLGNLTATRFFTQPTTLFYN